MKLMLNRIEQRVGAIPHLYPLDLTLVPSAVTVLLGATQAGKITLMRVMAGLDVPAKGGVLGATNSRNSSPTVSPLLSTRLPSPPRRCCSAATRQ